MRIALSKPVGDKRFSKNLEKNELIDRYSGIKFDYANRQKAQKLLHVANNIEGKFFHSNYLEYLGIAWSNHYGIVISPDVVWFTLLSEIVQIVAQNPEKYAFLFTKVPDKKQNIIIMTESLEIMPLDKLIHAIKNLVPTNTNIFLPDFTTSTDRSRMARYASFADLVSPYYTYSMMLCGIPFVDIQGADEDWQVVLSNWQDIGKLFPDYKEYFAKTINLLEQLIFDRYNPEFLDKIFRFERCGSGSQVEAYGWWTDFYREQPEDLRCINNFVSHVAKVSYSQIDINKKYEMYQGLFYSNCQDDCLVPDFGQIIFNVLDQPKIESY